jgi:hypothetical protein
MTHNEVIRIHTDEALHLLNVVAEEIARGDNPNPTLKAARDHLRIIEALLEGAEDG